MFNDPVKGVDVLLEAFSKIYKNNNRLHLLIIGINPEIADANYRTNIKSEAWKQVHWLGIVDRGWEKLNAVDFYVQPSRSEGLCLAIMEAMALKLPIVATTAGGNPEAVIDGVTGFLAEHNSVESLSEAIEQMLAAQSKWEAMGEAGYRRYIQLFRGENSIKTLVDKYYSI